MALVACEDVIDIGLDDADPKLVIVGEVLYPLNMQVTISRTVSFGSEGAFDPVSGANVTIHMEGTETYVLEEVSPGIYRSPITSVPRTNNAGLRQGMPACHLLVTVDGKSFTATSTPPNPVPIDSIGTTVSNIFGEERKFVSVKYQDPPNEPNYYRFLRSVNGNPFEMVYVTNDKFNDGKYVTEDMADFDTEFFTGDSVMIRMQNIDKAAFDFWNAVQSINPGSAAPANPPSVFGDDALGYFSAYVQSQVSTVVQ